MGGGQKGGRREDVLQPRASAQPSSHHALPLPPPHHSHKHSIPPPPLPPGHYADAGEVAVLMSCTLDVQMVMTGHSLGRNKLEHLLASGGAWRGGGGAVHVPQPA